jgi:hypothetical protein
MVEQQGRGLEQVGFHAENRPPLAAEEEAAVQHEQEVAVAVEALEMGPVAEPVAHPVTC